MLQRFRQITNLSLRCQRFSEEGRVAPPKKLLRKCKSPTISHLEDPKISVVLWDETRVGAKTKEREPLPKILQDIFKPVLY